MKLALSLLAAISLAGSVGFAQSRHGSSQSHSSAPASHESHQTHSAPKSYSAPKYEAPKRSEPSTPKYESRRESSGTSQKSSSSNSNSGWGGYFGNQSKSKAQSHTQSNPPPVKHEEPKREERRQTTTTQPAKTQPAQNNNRQQNTNQQTTKREETKREEQKREQSNNKKTNNNQTNNNQTNNNQTNNNHQTINNPPPVNTKREQRQQEIRQQRQAETQQVKQQLPQHVANKIPPTSNAHMSKDGKQLIVRDADNKTRILDPNTGKQRAVFDKNTGKAVYTPKSGKVTVVDQRAGYVKKTAPNGWSQVKQTEHVRIGNQEVSVKTTTTSYRGTTYKQSSAVMGVDGHARYQVNKSRTYIVNNRTVVVNNNYNYVVVNRYGGYGIYEPVWWAQPTVAWGYYASPGVYVNFYTGFYGSHYYWGPAGFVVWTSNYYYSRPAWYGCWEPTYGWGWWNYPYYHYGMYYEPWPYYPSFSYWLADYWFQRTLEDEIAAREAARLERERNAELRLEEDEFQNANAAAFQTVSEKLDVDTRNYLRIQVEDMVKAIKEHQQLDAGDLMYRGYLFTVNDPLTEDVNVDGMDLQCRITAGDILMMDNWDQHPDVIMVDQTDEDGNDILDGNGNVVQKAFVTAYVKKSKVGSCREGTRFQVSVEALQDMVNHQMNSVELGIEEAVKRNIHP